MSDLYYAGKGCECFAQSEDYCNCDVDVDWTDPEIYMLRERVEELEEENAELVDFCIWFTGCGYDFTQHEHFNKQRDKLLLNKGGDL